MAEPRRGVEVDGEVGGGVRAMQLLLYLHVVCVVLLCVVVEPEFRRIARL